MQSTLTAKVSLIQGLNDLVRVSIDGATFKTAQLHGGTFEKPVYIDAFRLAENLTIAMQTLDEALGTVDIEARN